MFIRGKEYLGAMGVLYPLNPILDSVQRDSLLKAARLLLTGMWDVL